MHVALEAIKLLKVTVMFIHGLTTEGHGIVHTGSQQNLSLSKYLPNSQTSFNSSLVRYYRKVTTGFLKLNVRALQS